jgi:hypothetical protein
MLEIVYPEGDYEISSLPFDLCGELGTHKRGHRKLATDVDQLISSSGSGEHGCVHSTLTGKLQLPQGSGLWESYSSRFSPTNYPSPLCEGLKYGAKISGCFFFQDVRGQLIEELPSILLNYRTHRSYQGEVSHNTIHIVKREALWAGPEDGRYYFASFAEYDLHRDGNSDTFVGYYRSGGIDAPPQGKRNYQQFPACPLQPASTERVVTFTPMPIGQVQSSIDGLLTDSEFRLMIATAVMRHNANQVKLARLDASDVAARACSEIRPLDYNNLENASQATDLSSITRLIPGVLDTVMDPDPVKVAKLLANGTLVYKYAVKPTVADVRQAIDYKKDQCRVALDSLQSGVFRASKKEHPSDNVWTQVACKVSTHPTAKDAVTDTLNVLDNLGLLPSLQRLWDFVPYSFVVDWGANTSSLLQSIDMNLSRTRYGIDGCTYSKKYVEDKICEADYTFNGCSYHFDGFKSRHYVRTASAFLPTELHTHLRGAFTSNHIVAGGALLIANL